MSEHMFVLRPPTRPLFLPQPWSPWKCICGVGGTGATDELAEEQYNYHLLGIWPCYIEPVPNSEPYITETGKVVWFVPKEN